MYCVFQCLKEKYFYFETFQGYREKNREREIEKICSGLSPSDDANDLAAFSPALLFSVVVWGYHLNRYFGKYHKKTTQMRLG